MAAKTLLYTAADETLAPINTYSGENKATKLVVNFSNCGVDTYVKWVRFSNSEPILLGTAISVEYEVPVEFMARGRLEVQPYAIGLDGQVVKFAIRAIPVNRSLEESDENTYDPTDLESIQAAVSDAVIQVGAIWEAYNTGELDGEDGLDGLDGTNGVDGAKIISASFVGNDLVFGLDDASTVALVGAKNTLKGEVGATGLTGATGATVTSVAFVGNDIVFTKSDATTVTLAGAKLALKGDTGATGATGLTGATGATPNITIGTVTTGAAGSSVIVTKTGTTLNPIFNFTIPRGDTGATGATGANGEDGKNFTILGQYASLSALQSAHPTGMAGDVWAVGTSESSDLYIWDTVTNGWKDIGQVGINLDASSVTLEDLAGDYTATDVEAAFAELITKLGTKAIKPTNEGTATNIHLLKSNGDGTSTFVDTGAVIAATVEKTTPVDADKFLISDSANANNGRRLTWASIKSTLKAYFDTLYNNYVHPANHPASIITQDASNRFVTDTEKSTWNGKANGTHSHLTSDVTGLDTTLAGKANTSHTHATSDATGLDTALAGKASSTHSHSIGDVTGLESELGGKADASHTHAISDITNLQTTLNGKAPLASPTFTGTPTISGSGRVISDSASTGTDIYFVWSGTQAQYDAIGTKDANTLYFIV